MRFHIDQWALLQLDRIIIRSTETGKFDYLAYGKCALVGEYGPERAEKFRHRIYDEAKTERFDEVFLQDVERKYPTPYVCGLDLV